LTDKHLRRKVLEVLEEYGIELIPSRFSADGGEPPSASQRSPRAPSPQRLTTSRLVAHHPTGLGNSGSPINIATGAYKLSI
jgi:hypothetical protein